MHIHKIIKHLKEILALINLIIVFFSCKNGIEEVTEYTEQNLRRQINIGPKEEIDKLYKELKNKYSYSNNTLTTFDKNSLKTLQEKLKLKSKKEKQEILNAIKERNKKIDIILNAENENKDPLERTGMIMYNPNDSGKVILNKEKLTEIIKGQKHNETDVESLKKVNKKLQKLISTNKIIKDLITENSQKEVISSEENLHYNDVYNIEKDIKNDKRLVYGNTEDVLNDLDKLNKTKQYKNKEEILQIMQENKELIKKIKTNKYFYYVFEEDEKNNELKKRKTNIDYYIINRVKKAYIDKNKIAKSYIKDVGKFCKLIIQGNKLKKEKLLYISGEIRNNFDLNINITIPDIYMAIGTNKVATYKDYIDIMIKESLFEVITVSKTNRTIFNSGLPIKILNDNEKLEKILEYSIQYIEEVYDFNKDFIKEKYKNKIDLTGEVIDTTNKKAFIASMLNFSKGDKNIQNLSHIIGEAITKENYTKLGSIIKYLYKKGMKIDKNETKKENNKTTEIPNSSLIEKAKKNKISINIDNNGHLKFVVIP